MAQAKARLGTNPICFAIPSNLDGPLVFDMATSAAAAGKINVATARGEQVPAGWLIDAEGKPSTDPRVLRSGGALLPLGGTEGYKGTGLAAIVEIYVGFVDRPWVRCAIPPGGTRRRCFYKGVQRPPRFATSRHCLAQEVHRFRALPGKDTPKAEGFKEVFYPGRSMHRKEQDRRKNGVPIEDATWKRLSDLATGYGGIANKLGF